MRKIAGIITATVISVGCSMLESPTAPSSRGRINDLTAWYPCVIVQTPGFRGENVFENQFDALKKLQRAGRLSWVRFGFSDNPAYYDEARRLGLKILSIIGTDQLDRGRSWEDSFDATYYRFPSDIWEIGNEISNPLVNNRVMTSEEYVSKLKNLYHHIKNKYPGIVLASSPTVGSVGGPREFEEYIEFGLLDMDIIITVNIYSDASLQQYAAIFNKYRSRLAGKRIWVTETGSPAPESQIYWVESFYSKIISTLNPEMVCWYGLWLGDDGGDSGFGLINNIIPSRNYEERSLFRRLTGGL